MANTTNESTLIATFNSLREAHNAAQELERQGIETGRIQIHADASSGTIDRPITQHEGGFVGWLKSVFGADDEEQERYQSAIGAGRAIVSVTVPESDVDRVGDILDRMNPVNVNENAAQASSASVGSTASRTTGAMGVPQTGSTERPTKTGTDIGAGERGRGDASTVPVVEEDLAVGKRAYQRGGVRVYSRVVERPVEETVRLREERVYVDRQPTDRPVTPGEIRAGAEQVIEVQEIAEEPVVEKRARVVEEVRVGKEVSEREETVRDTVRRTEVNVEPLNETRAGGAGAASSTAGSARAASAGVGGTAAGPYDADFRSNFNQNYASAGGSYDTYAPAYQYGYSSANDPRYRNRQFEDVESDLRSDYERRNPNSSWDRMKGAIRYGWDRVTGKV